MSKTNKWKTRQKQGSILVLAAVFITLMLVSLATVVDLGLIVVNRSDLQNIADSTALATAHELPIDNAIRSGMGKDQNPDLAAGRTVASEYADRNLSGFLIDQNEANAEDGGIVFGFIQDPNDWNSPLQTTGVDQFNSVKVSAARSAEINGPFSLLLGVFTGLNEIEVQADAVAAAENRVAGFTLNDWETLPMFPIALHEDTWTKTFDGVSDIDKYTVQDDTVTMGPDGIPEILMAPWFPNQGLPGRDGNARTMYLTDTPTAEHIRDQILNGMSKEDLEGSNVNGLVLTDALGEFCKWVPGDQIMDSSWHDAFNQIQGEKRVVALFGDVTGEEGSGQSLKITGFQAVTILESFWPPQEQTRRVVLQPAQMNVPTAVINPDMGGSDTVYSVSLIR